MKLSRAASSLLARVRDVRERHRERHRPTGYGYAFADSIEYLDGRWDGLTAGASVFLSRRYRQALESAGVAGVQHRYALVFRGPHPVAAIAAQVLTVAASKLAPGAERAARAPGLARMQERLLVCGNLFSWGQHGVAFAAGEDPAALWPAVAEALYRIRRAEQLAGGADFVMVKDVPDAEAAAASKLRRCSYRALKTEPDMVLAIDPRWRTYEDYLAALKSNYRKAAQKIEREVAEAGYRLEGLNDVAGHAEALHRLYLQVHGEAKLRLVTLTPGFLSGMAQAFGDDLRFRVLRREGGEIAGFVTTLKDGETAVGWYIGFDRRQNASAPLYFRLLQSVVADAIDMGARRLSIGRTALEPKARLGARPAPLRVFVRHRVPMLNVVVRNLLSLVPHDEAPERAPLKETR